MSVNVAAQSEVIVNPFQRYLIPVESKWVRYVMQKAGEYSRSGNILTSRAFSVACAIAATVVSMFNMFSYLLQAPIRILLNVVTFSPVNLVVNLISDLTNAMLSFVFVSLGVTFLIAGILLPEPVFTNFAPEKELSLESELKLKEEEINRRDVEIEKLRFRIEKLSEYIPKVERELDDAKVELRKVLARPPNASVDSSSKPAGWRFWW